MYKKQEMIKELVSLNDKEILNKISLLKKELFIHRSNNKTSSNIEEGFNVMNIKKIKKKIARALTIYNNRKDS